MEEIVLIILIGIMAAAGLGSIIMIFRMAFENFTLCNHKYIFHKDYGFTYQEMKCTKCGKSKIIDK